MNAKKDSSEFTEVNIPVPWGTIAGKWWGSTTVQPIIALHGWLDNCGSFDNLAPLLSKAGQSVLCVDLPGHGFSSHIPKGQNYYIFWDGVFYLRRIVTHFKWSKITIIGHSIGGCIALLYAATFPNDIKAFVSLDAAAPCGRLPEEVLLDELGTSVDRILGMEKPIQTPCFTQDQILSSFLKAFNGSVDRKGCEILLQRGMKKSSRRDGYILTLDPRVKESAHEYMTFSQVLEFCSSITCKVLNIQADDTYPMDRPEYYSMTLDEIEKTAKKMERHRISGSGHHLHLMNADQIAPIILQFLSSQ